MRRALCLVPLVCLFLSACGSKTEAKVDLLPGEEQVAKTHVVLENKTDLVWSESRDQLFQGVFKAFKDYTGAPSMAEFPINITLTEEPVAMWVYFNPKNGEIRDFKSQEEIPADLDRSLVHSPIAISTKVESDGKVIGVNIQISVGTLRPKVAKYSGITLEEAVTFFLFHEMWHTFGYFLDSKGVQSGPLHVQSESWADSIGNAVRARAENESFSMMGSKSINSYPGAPDPPAVLTEFYNMLPRVGLPFKSR